MPSTTKRHPHRRRGLCHPVIPGCAEEEQRAGVAGTGFARHRAVPGVAAVPAVAKQPPAVSAAAPLPSLTPSRWLFRAAAHCAARRYVIWAVFS